MYGFALYLLDCGMCQGVYKVVHFTLRADVVGSLKNGLLLSFSHFGIGVHRRLVYSQRHTETDRDFIGLRL